MKTILLNTVLLSMVILTSCKKNKPDEGSLPEVVEPRISIKLNTEYLPAAKVDSAIIIWETDGQVQEMQMSLSNDTLYLAKKELAEGIGHLTIQIYTGIQLRHRKLQWEKRIETTIKRQESIHMAAPTHLHDPAWFPRVILIDQPSPFTAIVALRPEDPYFFLKNIPVGFKIELERNYVAKPGGAVIVGGRLWKCNTVCTDTRGIIEDRNYFIPLPTIIKDRKWEMVEVGIGLFGSNNTSGPVFYFNHY